LVSPPAEILLSHGAREAISKVKFMEGQTPREGRERADLFYTLNKRSENQSRDDEREWDGLGGWGGGFIED